MRAGHVWFPAVLASLLACAGGSPGDGTGAVQIAMPLSGPSAGLVTRVTVTVSGPGIPTPIAVDLTAAYGQWAGVVDRIPAGADRTIAASALGAAGETLYAGTATGVTVPRNATALVLVVAQQVTAPPAYSNAPPVIDAVIASTLTAEPGQAVTFTVRAHDPDGEGLAYAWSAPDGDLGAPASAATTWTAPATEGPRTIALAVTDPKGATATLSFSVQVQQTPGKGALGITVRVNSWPVVEDAQVAPSDIDVGQATTASLRASDADGDLLAYVWTSDCAGTFAAPTAAATAFTPAEQPLTGFCTLTASVTDGRGGSTTGTVLLQVRAPIAADAAPVFDLAYQSATAAFQSETIVLRATAHDPEGSPIAFAWTATAGTLSDEADSADASEVRWHAPPVAPNCTGAPATATVTVADPLGAATSYVFSLQTCPQSCAQIQAANPAAASGWYTVNPSGSQAFQAWCDFGGGAWPTGSGGALVVAAGETVTLTSGVAHDYQSIDVRQGGTLRLTGPGWVTIGVVGDVTIDGVVDGAGGLGAFSASGNAPAADGTLTAEPLAFAPALAAGGWGGRGASSGYAAGGAGGMAGNGGAGGNTRTDPNRCYAGGGGGGSSAGGHEGAGWNCPNAAWGGGAGAQLGWPGGAAYPSGWPGGGAGNALGIGTGGGGGGGAAHTVAHCFIACSWELATGGGGGGGGAPGTSGQAVYLRAGGMVKGAGTIDLRGGAGGAGGSGSNADLGGGGGGGGAGGAGGALLLRLRAGAALPSTLTVKVDGGRGGPAGSGGWGAQASGGPGSDGATGTAGTVDVRSYL